MKLKTAFSLFALLLSLSAVTNAPASAQTRKHSAAWYRTHRTHSAAWYRTHRAPAHSAAWYRTHQKHSAAWYRKHNR